MKRKTDYLLKYISNDTYEEILAKITSHVIENLIDNRIDVDLNIRYLISYGVKDIDKVIKDRLDDLLLSNNDFIEKIEKYELKLGKDNLISMLENS